MSNALILNEKPGSEPLPSSAGTSSLINGHYAPVAKDSDGYTWVRSNGTIQGSAAELYAIWRNIERIPQWQDEVVSVTQTSPKTSHWIMQHGDHLIEWDVETLADEPASRIAWHSTVGDVDQSGEVIFETAIGNRETMITLLMRFKLGTLERALATITGRDLKQAVVENLRHFKAFAETGEIPRAQSAPHGDRGLVGGMKRSMYGENIPTPSGK